MFIDDLSLKRRKKIKVQGETIYVNYSNVYDFGELTEEDIMQELTSGKYGSVTNDMIDLYKRSMNFSNIARRLPDETTEEPGVLVESYVMLEDDCVDQGTGTAPVSTMPAGSSPLVNSKVT